MSPSSSSKSNEGKRILDGRVWREGLGKIGPSSSSSPKGFIDLAIGGVVNGDTAVSGDICGAGEED